MYTYILWWWCRRRWQRMHTKCRATPLYHWNENTHNLTYQPHRATAYRTLKCCSICSNQSGWLLGGREEVSWNGNYGFGSGDRMFYCANEGRTVIEELSLCHIIHALLVFSQTIQKQNSYWCDVDVFRCSCCTWHPTIPNHTSLNIQWRRTIQIAQRWAQQQQHKWDTRFWGESIVWKYVYTYIWPPIRQYSKIYWKQRSIARQKKSEQHLGI